MSNATSTGIFTSTHMPEFDRLCRNGGSQVHREIALMDAFTEAVTHIRELEVRPDIEALRGPAIENLKAEFGWMDEHDRQCAVDAILGPKP